MITTTCEHWRVWATHRLHPNSSCSPTERQVTAVLNILAREGKQLSPIYTWDAKCTTETGRYLIPCAQYLKEQALGILKLRTFLRHIFDFMQQCGFIKLHCLLCFLFTVNLQKRFKTAQLRFQGSKLFFKVEQLEGKNFALRYRLKQSLFCFQSACCKLSWGDH